MDLKGLKNIISKSTCSNSNRLKSGVRGGYNYNALRFVDILLDFLGIIDRRYEWNREPASVFTAQIYSRAYFIVSSAKIKQVWRVESGNHSLPLRDKVFLVYALGFYLLTTYFYQPNKFFCSNKGLVSFSNFCLIVMVLTQSLKVYMLGNIQLSTVRFLSPQKSGRMFGGVCYPEVWC